jgi:hypothetical protein
MPGNAIGRTARKLSEFLPKNSNRCSANDNIDPNTTAITIAISANLVDELNASRALSTSKNVDHQRVENPLGGQVRELAVLNDNMKINSNGV